MNQTAHPARRQPKRTAIRHLAIGHDAIDADHKIIVDCCNQVAVCDLAEFEFLIRRLQVLFIDHFRKESDLLASVGGTLCSCHRVDHEELLAICDRAKKLHLRDHRAAQRLIRRDLARALREHIVYRDQVVALRLNSAENGCRMR